MRTITCDRCGEPLIAGFHQVFMIVGIDSTMYPMMPKEGILTNEGAKDLCAECMLDVLKYSKSKREHE
jgi:hypothetical protein